MRNKSIYVSSNELKDCLYHCGFCKKQDVFQNFQKEKKDDYYKCAHCGRFIKRLYENKTEKVHNIPIMERNHKDYLEKHKSDNNYRPYVKYK